MDIWWCLSASRLVAARGAYQRHEMILQRDVKFGSRSGFRNVLGENEFVNPVWVLCLHFCKGFVFMHAKVEFPL